MNEPINNGEKSENRDEKGRFVRGHGGGPGRPKGSINLSITERLKAELQRVPEGQKIDYADAFVKKIMKQAVIDGDQPTQKLIMNYVDGLPRQNIDFGVDREGLEELTEMFKAMANKTESK